MPMKMPFGPQWFQDFRLANAEPADGRCARVRKGRYQSHEEDFQEQGCGDC